MNREPIHYFVLDALANDIETLDDILRILNSSSELGWRDIHPEPFTRQELIPAILRCVKEGSIAVCVFSDGELEDAGDRVLPPGSFDDFWFRITSRGRMLLDAWNPPPRSPN